MKFGTNTVQHGIRNAVQTSLQSICFLEVSFTLAITIQIPNSINLINHTQVMKFFYVDMTLS